MVQQQIAACDRKMPAFLLLLLLRIANAGHLVYAVRRDPRSLGCSQAVLVAMLVLLRKSSHQAAK